MQKVAGTYFRGLRSGKSQLGGLDPADCAGVGFGGRVSVPEEAAGGCKTVAGAYFRGRRACTQYDPKIILGATTVDLKSDAYYGS